MDSALLNTFLSSLCPSTGAGQPPCVLVSREGRGARGGGGEGRGLRPAWVPVPAASWFVPSRSRSQAQYSRYPTVVARPHHSSTLYCTRTIKGANPGVRMKCSSDSVNTLQERHNTTRTALFLAPFTPNAQRSVSLANEIQLIPPN
jgi:hypothetical protein